jgi:hypothetical protein
VSHGCYSMFTGGVAGRANLESRLDENGWRTGRTPSKAANAEAMRASGDFFAKRTQSSLRREKRSIQDARNRFSEVVEAARANHRP